MAAGALRETRCARVTLVLQYTLYMILYFIAKCIVLILIYRGKNIITATNAKVQIMLYIVRQCMDSPPAWLGAADGWEEEDLLL